MKSLNRRIAEYLAEYLREEGIIFSDYLKPLNDLEEILFQGLETFESINDKFTVNQIDVIANFCRFQNNNFDAERFKEYIKKENNIKSNV